METVWSLIAEYIMAVFSAHALVNYQVSAPVKGTYALTVKDVDFYCVFNALETHSAAF